MKTIYKNVLLSDGKIVNWKTGTTHWDSVSKAFHNRQPRFIFDMKEGMLSVSSVCKEVETDEENNAWFEDKEFYKQFEVHEKFPSSMFLPY